MKIAYCSDLHLEFGDLVLSNTGKADVLILAGDMLIAEHLRRYPELPDVFGVRPRARNQKLASRYRSFIERISNEFQVVLTVAGNHEFYFGTWNGDVEYLRTFYSNYGNIHLLEMDHVILDDVTFTGGTLWTDCNNSDMLTMCELNVRMNDYNKIKSDLNRYSNITPEDTIERHLETVRYLENILRENLTEKYVVIGHHAPSPLSTKINNKENYCFNGAYMTDLTELILQYQKIAYWVHGHVHQPFDYMIGSTRVVCNPRGYKGRQKIADGFQLKYLDI